MDTTTLPVTDSDFAKEVERALAPDEVREDVPVVRLEKLRYSHDAMVDLLIANPGIHQNAIAARFGYTPAWVSTIMASDAFKTRLATRREQLVDPSILASIEERFSALAEKSLAVLQEKLAQPQVSDDLALKALALGAKALGIGGNASAKTVVINSNERLDNLAKRLTGLLTTAKTGEVVDVEAKQVGND